MKFNQTKQIEGHQASTAESVPHIQTTKLDATVKIPFKKQHQCAFQGLQHVPASPYYSRKRGFKNRLGQVAIY